MSRPKPEVLLEYTNRNTYKTEQVLASSGIWTVFYQGRAINYKSFNSLIGYPGPKYKKLAFSNPGHAKNLCRKLNRLFKTTDFTVVLLEQGTEVYAESQKSNSS